MNYQTIRRKTNAVTVGSVGIGGEHPIAIQSMTNTDPHDALSTAAQILRLQEAGCDIVRVTVPDLEAAECIPVIRRQGVRIPMSAYITKSKRRKLTNAFSTESLPVGAFYESKNPIQIFLRTDNGKGMLIKSNLIIDKTTRTSSGKQIFQLTRKAKVEMATDQIERLGEDALQCRKLALPSTGVNISKMKFNF